MKKTFRILPIILILLLYWNCNSVNDLVNTKEFNDDDIILGAIMSIDNSSGELSKTVLNLAEEYINDNGGILNGRRLKFDLRSSKPMYNKLRTEISKLAAEDLLKTHPYLAGFVTWSSSASRAITLEVAEKHQMPVVSSASTADANTGLSEYFHRLAPPDRFQAEILAKKAYESGIRKVAIAIEKGDIYSEGLAKSFYTAFTSLGGVITDTVKFILEETEYLNKLKILYQNKPEAVLTAALTVDTEIANKIFDNLGSLKLSAEDIRFLFSDAQNDKNTLTQYPKEFLLGEVNNYPRSFGVSAFPDINTESYKLFENLLSEKINRQVEVWDAQHFDVILLYAIAIEVTKNNGFDLQNIEAFRKELNKQIRLVSNPNNSAKIIRPEMGWQNILKIIKQGSVNYEGVSGNCNINDQGDVITNYDIFMIRENTSGVLEFFTLENVSP